MELEASLDSQSRQREWEAFRSLALTAVRAGLRPETARGERSERLLQILELPSFDAVTGWEIFRITHHDAIREGRYIAARTCWQQKQDVDRFYHPVERLTMLRLKYLKRLSPALAFTTQPLREDTAHEVESTLARLLSAPMPLLVGSKRLGLDGTSYEINMGDHWAGVRFHWWEQAPVEWTLLEKTVMVLMNTLQRLMVEEAQK